MVQNQDFLEKLREILKVLVQAWQESGFALDHRSLIKFRSRSSR